MSSPIIEELEDGELMDRSMAEIAKEMRRGEVLQSAAESVNTLPRIYWDLTRYPMEDIDLREMLRSLVVHLWRIDSSIQQLEVNIRRDAKKAKSWDALVANQDAVDAAMNRPSEPRHAIWTDEDTWVCPHGARHGASIPRCSECGLDRPAPFDAEEARP